MKSYKTPRKVALIPPEENTGLSIGTPSHNAGGFPAIRSVYKHITREMGLLKGVRVLSRLNQKGGFDCPSCAWPDPEKKRSAFGEFCENGAKAVAEEATSKRVTADFFAGHSVEDLSRKSDFWIGKRGRLTHPMVLKSGSSHYEPISWEDAFSMIGAELNSLDHPDQAIFYTSGRTSNEAAFMYQLFAREFGTNNLPDCSNMCHESSGVALSETLGIGKGSVTLEDFPAAEVIVLIGQNPGTNHPRMLTALKKCKKNGGKIISINPLEETAFHKFSHPQDPADLLTGGTKIADMFLQVRINGDVALLKALIKLLLEYETKSPGSVFDMDFIEAKTQGFNSLVSHLNNTDLDQLLRECGVEFSRVKQAADLLAKKDRIIVCWAMGLTQHENAVHNIREIVNLLLLKGSIGKRGAGTCPVRGHSNVQGDRTMGIWESPTDHFLDKLEERFSIKVPRDHGFNTINAIKAMQEGKAAVFVGMGGNFISATPDSILTARAMQNCRLTVQVSTKLNRSHIVTGEQALILPCLSRSESDVQKSGPQFVSVENSMGIVHSSMGAWKPASPDLLSEPAIIAGIAKETLSGRSRTNWDEMIENYDVIRKHIEHVISGFEGYNEKIRKPEGFYLPNATRKRNFKTDTRKAKFTVNPIATHKLADGQFLMMTIRSHDQFNTTIYDLNDRYRGVQHERRVVFMNKLDMERRGLDPGRLVNIKSQFQNEERIARSFHVVPFNIAHGCLATYFPEANVLVPLNKVADKSDTPSSKSFVVTLETAS